MWVLIEGKTDPDETSLEEADTSFLEVKWIFLSKQIVLKVFYLQHIMASSKNNSKKSL